MKRKIDLKNASFNVINYIIMLLLVFICVYPFYYIFIYSISDPTLAASGITFFPKGLTLENYKKVLELDGILPALGMSVSRTLLGTFITTLISAFLGYLFTKQLYCRKFFYRMLVVTMYVSGGLIPTYMVYKYYNLLNTFWIYVIPSAVSAYYIILTKTFIENLPASLEESAKLDGAGYLTVFTKIVLPLSKPIIATIVVFEAVGQWNRWTDNYIYNTKESLNTLQLLLYNYLNESTRLAKILEETNDYNLAAGTQFTPMSIRMTITMLVIIPILCVYPYMQKYFVKGIMVGAIKG